MLERKTTSFGYTIFCDDIRYEIGNKVSYVGVYGSEMVLSGAQFPIVIPKLAMSITITEPMESIPEEIEVRIFFPGDDEHPVTTTNLKTGLDTRNNEAMENTVKPGHFENGRVAKFNIHAVVSPAEIKESGRIKVRAVIDGELMKLGTLGITLSDEPAAEHNP